MTVIATAPNSSTRLVLHVVASALVVFAMALAAFVVTEYWRRGWKAVDAPDARNRFWTSLALIAGGFFILSIDNYFMHFMPGGFRNLLAYACLAAMATGVIGSLVYAWSWRRLHSIGKRSV